MRVYPNNLWTNRGASLEHLWAPHPMLGSRLLIGGNVRLPASGFNNWGNTLFCLLFSRNCITISDYSPCVTKNMSNIHNLSEVCAYPWPKYRFKTLFTNCQHGRTVIKKPIFYDTTRGWPLPFFIASVRLFFSFAISAREISSSQQNAQWKKWLVAWWPTLWPFRVEAIDQPFFHTYR